VSLLDILYYPDAQLRRKAADVREVDGTIASLVDNMLETMYHAPGIGLAATQVNVHQRVVVIDVSKPTLMVYWLYVFSTKSITWRVSFS